MAASKDEASFNFQYDAPASPTTEFYALVGDNFYTYSTGPSDIDAYYLITAPGTTYTIIAVDNPTVGNAFITLYDANGNFPTPASDYGNYSAITFIATSTKYIIGLSSQFPGVYGARVSNDDIREANGIGETIAFGQVYSGAIDYVSDSDRFAFPVVAGAQYTLNVASSVTDLLIKATYLYTISGNGYLPLTVVSSGSGSYVYTAPETGIAEVNLSSNSFVRTGSYSLSVTQSLTNRAPTFSSSSQSVSTNEDTARAVNLSASDADGDVLTYSISASASNGTTSISGATVIYTPNRDYNGTDSFVIRASDGKGGTATQTINISVAAVNDAPYFSVSTASLTTSSNTPVSYTPTVYDVDNTTYTYTTSNPANGSVQTSGATITYTPRSGYSGDDSFTVTANDGSGGTAVQTIRISVSGDDYPNTTSTSGVITVGAVGSTGSIETVGDADAFSLNLTAGRTYTIAMLATSGAIDPSLKLYDLNLNELAFNDDYSSTIKSAVITYTANTTGTYYVQASSSGNLTGNYRVTAYSDDYAGFATSSSPQIAVNGAAATGSIENSIDVDAFKVILTAGTAYTFSMSATSGSLDPRLGLYDVNLNSISLNDNYTTSSNDAQITFTPTSSGTYYLGAEGATPATGSYRITVTGQTTNRAPSFSSSSQSVSTNEDASRSVTLAATDADGDALTYSVSSSAFNGTASLSGSTVTYTPRANFNGSDSFVVRASDGKGGTATQTINITVAAVNDAPTFSASSQSLSVTAGTAKTITLAATDVDGDALTYTTATPSKGSATISGSTLTYTPTSSATGADSFVVTARDPSGATATQTINVTLAAAPTTTSTDFRVTASDGWTGTIGGNGLVYGTSGYQDIKVLSGTVSFDASFNKGGDIIRLGGAAGSYSILRAGSSSQISNSSGLTATIPIGTVGAPIVFDDGARKLVFAGGSFLLGAQAFSTAAAAVVASPDGSNLPSGADAAANARISMAGNALSSGQSAHLTIGGKATIYGTAASDVIAVAPGVPANLVFDASFNKGGDTIVLGMNASSYTAARSGSSILLTASDQSLNIPIGTVGLTLRFADGDRTMVFANGMFKIGTQEITSTSATLSGGSVTVSLDVGTSAQLASVTGAAGKTIFTDDAAKGSYVRITQFETDDQLKITGAKESDYSFASGDLDNDGSADDLWIVYNNTALGIENDIGILNAISPSVFVFDKATAISAVGFSFISFG